MRTTKTLADIISSATGAKTHFDMWWAQASEGRQRFVAARNRHSDFFLASRDAHYVAFFIYFGQLFDKRADASSIRNYLNSAKSTIAPDDFAAYTDRHLVISDRAKPLLTIRNFQVAHVNQQLSESDVFAPLKTTWFKVRDTIYDSAAFVAELAGSSNGGEIGIPRDGRLAEATVSLFTALA